MDDKTPPMDVNEGRVIAFVDIETDSLDATKIYVCCVKRTTDKQVQVYMLKYLWQITHTKSI